MWKRTKVDAGGTPFVAAGASLHHECESFDHLCHLDKLTWLSAHNLVGGKKSQTLLSVHPLLYVHTLLDVHRIPNLFVGCLMSAI